MYNVCTFKEMTPGELVDDIGVVDSGDGLYNDDYEDRYIFKGSNPNNYVTFNNEEAGWRIISIEGDGALKIIKNESVGNIMWGSDYYNEWDSSGVEIYLSNTFYNTLNSIAQSQIVSYNFSTGHEIDDDNLSDIIKNENSEIWNGKVGVIRASEYLRANSNKNCETFSLNNNNYNTCRGTNWMYDSTNWWTLNAAGGSMKVYYVFSNGKIYFEDYNIMNSYNVRPVVYLSSSVKITDGDGSKSNPFIIE